MERTMQKTFVCGRQCGAAEEVAEDEKVIAGLMALSGLGFAGCAVESGTTRDGGLRVERRLLHAERVEPDEGRVGRGHGDRRSAAWTPEVDLMKVKIQAQYHMQDAVGLTDAAKNACASRGKTGCPNTQAILELQNPPSSTAAVSCRPGRWRRRTSPTI